MPFLHRHELVFGSMLMTIAVVLIGTQAMAATAAINKPRLSVSADDYVTISGEPFVLAIGNIGSGKSQMLSNIALPKTRFPIGKGGITKKLHCSRWDSGRMNICDTPGLKPGDDAGHLAQQALDLIFDDDEPKVPIKILYVVTKLELEDGPDAVVNRVDALREVLRKEDRVSITDSVVEVVVTHFDKTEEDIAHGEMQRLSAPLVSHTSPVEVTFCGTGNYKPLKVALLAWSKLWNDNFVYSDTLGDDERLILKKKPATGSRIDPEDNNKPARLKIEIWLCVGLSLGIVFALILGIIWTPSMLHNNHITNDNGLMMNTADTTNEDDRSADASVNPDEDATQPPSSSASRLGSGPMKPISITILSSVLAGTITMLFI